MDDRPYLTVGGEPLLEDGIDNDKAASSATPPTPLAVATEIALPSFALLLLLLLLLGVMRVAPIPLRRLDIAADDDEPIIPKAPAAGRL